MQTRSLRQSSFAPPLAFTVMLVAGTAISTAQAQTIPSNTTVAIRTIDPVDSDNTYAAKEYRASVDDSVVVNGTTVLPVGAPAWLRLFSVQQAGAVNGAASVTLRLVAVEVQGQRVSVDTGDATISSNSQAKSATKKAILGALIGTAIGAAVDGKTGAAKGAALGGAAGVAAAVVVGQRVQVPSETRLSFTLAQPATVPRVGAVRVGASPLAE